MAQIKKEKNIIPSFTLNNGIKIPMVGLGVYKIPKGTATQQAVATAFKLGYRHIDTAAFYKNEHDVGIAIKKSKISREEIFVTTKLHPLKIFNIEKAFYKSLKKLDLNYIDLYLVHAPFLRKKKVWKTLEEIYQRGHIKAIGVSNYGIKDLQKLLNIAKIIPAVNQVEFHPFLFQKELKDFCQSKNIVLEAHSPLTHGKYIHHEKIEQLAEKYHKSPAQILLRWSVQQGNIVIPKTQNPLKMKENINIFNFSIKKEDVILLNSLNTKKHVAFLSNFEKN